MKKMLLLLLASLLLLACEGSDAYQGQWKAMNTRGEKFQFTFTPTLFSIKDSTGKTKTYQYTQNAIKSENSTETYGIRLEDGRAYQIYFPINDESMGLILDENGTQMFSIARKKYISYDAIYQLN